MDLIFDKNFHLISFIIIASYIYIQKPQFLGSLNKILSHTIFIFLGVFYFQYRISYEVDTAFLISVLIILILKNMKEYEETFINENLVTINFYNSDEPLILNEGLYTLEDNNNKIPERLLSNISNISSLNINSKYFITITNNTNAEKLYRGDIVIQSNNPFLGVTSINIIPNNNSRYYISNEPFIE